MCKNLFCSWVHFGSCFHFKYLYPLGSLTNCKMFSISCTRHGFTAYLLFVFHNWARLGPYIHWFKMFLFCNLNFVLFGTFSNFRMFTVNIYHAKVYLLVFVASSCQIVIVFPILYYLFAVLRIANHIES